GGQRLARAARRDRPADGRLRPAPLPAPVGRPRGREPHGRGGARGVHGVSPALERPHFRRVALIGIGLINGSLSLVMRREGLADEIVACARTETTLAKARARGLADRTTTVPREAVPGADLVVLGTPVGAYGAVAEAMAPGLDPEAIVTDVGSIKAEVIRAVVPHLPDPSRFVAAHPVAGTEHSGPEAAFDTLFERRHCIL